MFNLNILTGHFVPQRIVKGYTAGRTIKVNILTQTT